MNSTVINSELRWRVGPRLFGRFCLTDHDRPWGTDRASGGEMARTGRTPFPGDYRVTKDDTFAVLKATVRNETTSHEDNRLYRVYPIVIKTQIKVRCHLDRLA